MKTNSKGELLCERCNDGVTIGEVITMCGLNPQVLCPNCREQAQRDFDDDPAVQLFWEKAARACSRRTNLRQT